MKRLLRDTAGKSGLEYLLIVASIGTLGAVPFWAFGLGMEKSITDTTHASALPLIRGKSLAHTADQVDGMCYVQTFADNGSNGEANAERLGADLAVHGFEDVYVTKSQGGYYVTRIRVSCDDASSVLSRYNALGITSDAFVGNLPKSDDELFSGSASAPASDGEQLELPLEETANEPTPEPDVNGGSGDSDNAAVGSNAQAGAGLPPRDVSNNPMQQALNEIKGLSDEELEGVLKQEGAPPTMAAIFEQIPQECLAEQASQSCANDPSLLAYYTLLNEAANELTYREFAAMSDEELTQSLQDAQMILEECTALSPAPAFTEEGYPAVSESCQNEAGEQFYAEFTSALEGVETQEAAMQAMQSFAQTDIAAQCWATQEQPSYDENGMMAATDACAGNEAKMNAFMDAQLNGEALMYTKDRRDFEALFGPEAYEGSHSLQLLEYDENGQLVRSERLYDQAETLGLVEPGAFEDAVAQDQATLDEVQGTEQPQLEQEQVEYKEEGGGGLFGFIGKAANWIGEKTKWNEAIDWIADIGGDIPVVDQVTNVLAGTLRLSNVINPVAWLLEPADTANFAKNLAIGVGKEFWDMGTGLAFGLVGDVGYNWFIKEGIMGGFGLLDGGQFWKSAGNFIAKTPGGLWNMATNILGTAYTAVDGSKPIDEQAQAFGRTGTFFGTVWLGGSAAAAKLGKIGRVGAASPLDEAAAAASRASAEASLKVATLSDEMAAASRAAASATDDAAKAAAQANYARLAAERKAVQSAGPDAASTAIRASDHAAEASTWLGKTRVGERVGSRAAGPVQAFYNTRVMRAPTNAWGRFADGLQGVARGGGGTAGRVARATGTPQTFDLLRRGANKWAAAPQWGIPFRHPYAMGAGGLVYKSGARTDDADYYLAASKQMVKSMSEGMAPGGGGGLTGAASKAAGAGQ